MICTRVVLVFLALDWTVGGRAYFVVGVGFSVVGVVCWSMEAYVGVVIVVVVIVELLLLVSVVVWGWRCWRGVLVFLLCMLLVISGRGGRFKGVDIGASGWSGIGSTGDCVGGDGA